MYWFKSRYYLIAVLTTVLFGCGPGDHSEGGIRPVNTFSLSALVDSVFRDGGLDSIRDEVVKTISVNDEAPEEKPFDRYNIKNDIEDLDAFDFSSLRWFEGYQLKKTDSLSFTIYTYRTENQKAPADLARIYYDQDKKLQRIFVHKDKKSFVSRQRLTVDWNVGKEYTLSKKSSLLFQKPSIFVMNVKY